MSWKVLAVALLALVIGAMFSSGAEAVRRNQMQIGDDEPEAPAPVKKLPVKALTPAPEDQDQPEAQAQPESTWHSAPAPAPRLAEDEVPAAAPEAIPVLPVVDAASQLVRLQFDGAETGVSDTQKPEMDTLAQRMKNEPALRITLNSFSSPREGQLGEARRISLKRAMAVSYLIGKGVEKDRINVRALGDQVADEPKDRLDVTGL